MGYIFARALALPLSLLLALPPGWCCGVACLCPSAGAPAAESPPSCCGHGACQPGSTTPCGAPHSRTPSQPERLCCRSVDAALLKAEPFSPDLDLSALLPAATQQPASAYGPRAVAADISPPPPLPLQLLHCVWTC